MELTRPHCLYMFEFVVDDLVITRKNDCAPVEYPTCVEITFRSNVFVNICDRDYGSCVNLEAPQCGKRCIFALESPITKKDRLLVHVYKEKSNKCKFLIGLAEVKVKELFDNAYEEMEEDEEYSWELIQAHLNEMPRLKQKRTEDLPANYCYEAGIKRVEQRCPGSDLSKTFVPLFNLCKQQTGNIVLIMHLVCQGPTIVSAFCQDGDKYVPKPSKLDKDPCFIIREERDYEYPKEVLRYFACNVDKLCPGDICQDEFDRDCPTVPCKRQCPRIVQRRVHEKICCDIPRFPDFISWEKLDVKGKEKKLQEECEERKIGK